MGMKRNRLVTENTTATS